MSVVELVQLDRKEWEVLSHNLRSGQNAPSSFVFENVGFPKVGSPSELMFQTPHHIVVDKQKMSSLLDAVEHHGGQVGELRKTLNNGLTVLPNLKAHDILGSNWANMGCNSGTTWWGRKPFVEFGENLSRDQYDVIAQHLKKGFPDCEVAYKKGKVLVTGIGHDAHTPNYVRIKRHLNTLDHSLVHEEHGFAPPARALPKTPITKPKTYTATSPPILDKKHQSFSHLTDAQKAERVTFLKDPQFDPAVKKELVAVEKDLPKTGRRFEHGGNTVTFFRDGSVIEHNPVNKTLSMVHQDEAVKKAVENGTRQGKRMVSPAMKMMEKQHGIKYTLRMQNLEPATRSLQQTVGETLVADIKKTTAMSPGTQRDILEATHDTRQKVQKLLEPAIKTHADTHGKLPPKKLVHEVARDLAKKPVADLARMDSAAVQKMLSREARIERVAQKMQARLPAADRLVPVAPKELRLARRLDKFNAAFRPGQVIPSAEKALMREVPAAVQAVAKAKGGGWGKFFEHGGNALGKGAEIGGGAFKAVGKAGLVAAGVAAAGVGLAMLANWGSSRGRDSYTPLPDSFTNPDGEMGLGAGAEAAVVEPKRGSWMERIQPLTPQEVQQAAR